MENEITNEKKENWLEKNWFKLGILVAIFLSIYLLFILPQQREYEAQAQAERVQQKAKIEYDTCIVQAEMNYSSAWKSRCADYKVFNEKGWNDCMNMPYALKSICDSTWDKGPTEEEIVTGSCTLPTAWANNLEEDRDKRKESCMKDYNMTIGF